MTLSTKTRAEIERDLAEIAEPNQDQLLEAVAAGDSAHIIQALTELVNAGRDKAARLRRLLQQETNGPDRQAIEKAFWLWWRSPDADQFKSGIWSPVENAFMAWKAANGLLTVGEPPPAQPPMKTAKEYAV